MYRHSAFLLDRVAAARKCVKGPEDKGDYDYEHRYAEHEHDEEIPETVNQQKSAD